MNTSSQIQRPVEIEAQIGGTAKGVIHGQSQFRDEDGFPVCGVRKTESFEIPSGCPSEAKLCSFPQVSELGVRHHLAFSVSKDHPQTTL